MPKQALPFGWLNHRDKEPEEIFLSVLRGRRGDLFLFKGQTMQPLQVHEVEHNTVTSVLLCGSWHQIVPGTFHSDDHAFSFLSAAYNEWMLGPVDSINAVAIANQENNE